MLIEKNFSHTEGTDHRGQLVHLRLVGDGAQVQIAVPVDERALPLRLGPELVQAHLQDPQQGVADDPGASPQRRRAPPEAERLGLPDPLPPLGEWGPLLVIATP